MKSNNRLISAILVTTLLIQPLFSQRAADPDPSRFAKAIAEFAENDAENFFGTGGIVFVGSSSIRRLNIQRVPNGKLLVLASRPSPKRAAIMETELAFNYLLEMEAIKDERITYVRGACDQFFDQKGNFHLELFDDDMLHMSDQGYEIWNKILVPYLK